MIIRAAVAAAALVGGTFLALAPAARAASPSGAWTDPAPAGNDGGVPVAYVERPQQLRGSAEFDGGISGVAFTLVKDAADPPDPCSARPVVSNQVAPGGDGRVNFAFDAPFPCNRRYQVRATVAPRDRAFRDDGVLVLNLWVAVAIPPAPTTGLTASAGSGTVDLRWDAAAHEPDFVGYQVRRSAGGGEPTAIGETGPDGSSFVDDDLPAGGGTLRYQVVGMRPGPDAGTTVFASSGTPATVDVAPRSGGAGPAPAPGSGGTGTSLGPAGAGPATPPGHRATTAPARRSTTATTVDTGYAERLPFRRPAAATAAPTGDPAVVARLEGDDDATRRQTLLLVAGATTAFSWAMVLRLLARRALPVP